MTSFSELAVIVGCLPPFKSLFKGRRSFRRYKSPNHDKDSSPGFPLEAIRNGSDETGDSSKAAPKLVPRSFHGDQHGFDGEYGGGYNVPHGAIGVRSDYVSCDLKAWGKSQHG